MDLNEKDEIGWPGTSGTFRFANDFYDFDLYEFRLKKYFIFK